MSRSVLSTIGICALLAGCGTKWTGPDADGDGFSAADGDCWEGEEGPIPGISGADIYPGAPDVWYDGVDADCAGNDDFDADGDGYVPEEFVGQDTVNIVENLGALHKGVDCWDAPDDVVLEDGSIDPDYLAEWRDDPDNDEWVAANPDDAFMPFVVVQGNFASDGGGFIQPRPSEVNPEAAEDPLYDDVDWDCAGGVEFDQDGDGEDASAQPRRSGAVGTDCVDGSPLEDFDVDNLAGLGPADINAAADDVWYDGVDQDCGGNDDCDQDGDGYGYVPPTGSAADPFGGAYDDSVLDEVCGVETEEDCKDTDASVAPDPDIDEIFYNGKDDNCIFGEGDNDGDKDGDGYWDVGYDFDAADDTVEGSIPTEEFRTDCWDDPDNRPENMETDQVFVFDPAQPDLADPSSLSAAFDVDGDGNTDEVAAADVNPDAFDRPYDGVDQDCAGDAEEDDFDWDGDGYSSLYQYADNSGSWVPRGDDCLDCSDDCESAAEGSDLEAVCAELCDNDAYVVLGSDPGVTNAGALFSASVNPGRTETWYDGTDADCSRTSDFDADGDFYGDRRYEASPNPWEYIEEARPGYYAGGLNGGGDCNDADPDFNPGPDGLAREDWYDGLDHDCGDNDDYDQDFDGDRSDDYAAARTTQGTDASGATLVVTTAGENPNTDCVDDTSVSDAASYSGQNTETWYDGKDYDCDGEDDYDVDLDGFRDDQYAPDATVQGTVTVVGTTENPNTDCVDDLLEASNAASYNPDATEVWYDGEDWDCAGDDDFDVDADGYRSEDETATATIQGSETVVALSAADSTDCVDDTDEASDAASYYPDATDAWYDGKDYDCAGDDDFDADGDGDRTDDHGLTATIQGDTTVHAASAATNSDCVDDPDEAADASSYRGDGTATDTWYDGKDYDCAGDDDYDADADDFRSDEYSAAATIQGDDTVVSSGANPNTDCVDDPLEASNADSYNPDATEIWYDSEDFDCAGDDDYDADADGFRSEDETAAATYQGADLVVAVSANPNTDCVDDPDEASDAASYYPAASDTWYDGKDYDCEGDDDYDQDADGDRSDDYSAAETIQGATTVVASGTNPNTDCVDTDTDYVGTPAAADTWYDGLDHDCVGNDDYDQDGDGYRTDEETAAPTTQDGTVVVSAGANPNTDCVDTDTTYNPGATDVWYDGEDWDCQEDDDYDQDGDGERSDAYAAAATDQDGEVVVALSENPNTDCVDTDTDYNAAATEVWYDGFDWDCQEDDDYDVDGDGDRSEDYAAARTHQDGTTVVAAGANPNTDCVDDPLDDPDAELYYSGASDDWYDGYDYDCVGDDDYDQDGDGDRSDDYAAAATVQGPDTVVASGDATNTDCVDTSTAYYGGNSDSWYDGLDTDCAGNDDYDQDGDGQRSDAYAAAATVQDTVTVVAIGANPTTDCVDTDTAYYDGAPDTWYDGFDHDCAGDDDYDRDGDGDRNEDYAAAATVQGATTVVPSGGNPNTDCVDTSATYRGTPAASDTWYDGLDTDCADNDDYDQDGDGERSDDYAAAATFHGAVAIIGAGANPNTDCVDTDTSYNTAATEIWYDSFDYDCGGDDDFDADGDGDRSDNYVATATVQGADTVVAVGANPNTDCVDSNTDYVGTPAATDAWYDGFDYDCVGNDDYDQDGDGERSDDYAAAATRQGPTTVVAIGANPNTDCVDTSTAYNTGATDTWYDGLDHDCVGNDDYDADGDGDRSDSYAAAATLQGATEVVAAGDAPNLDCLDDDVSYSSLAGDVWYDGEDHDCGGDDDYDADGDGDRSDVYAALATTRKGSTIVAAGANPNTDCVDTDANYYQSAPDDWYDGEDWDCLEDDDYDADGDGERSDDYAAAATVQDALTVVAAGANPNTDCVDTDTDYKASATDVWYDGEDWDCAGDDDYDQDGDGDRSDDYAAAATVQGATVVVAALADTNTDCVDTDTSYRGTPAATDAWYDGEDKDCAGNDDYDADGDGARSDAYAAAATEQDGFEVVSAGANPNNDCDDTDAAFIIDTFYADGDTDGYGNAAVTVEDCGPAAPSGYVADNTDCDDADTAVNPGASETADGVDEDCNGYIDDNGVILEGDDYLKITEFIPNPTGLDTGKEWIEVTNPNAFTIVLEEDLWTIGKDGTSPYTIAGPVTIAAGGHVVFGRNDDTTANGNVVIEEAYGSAILIGHTGSGTGTLYLEYDDPTTLLTERVDEVSYDFSGDWSALLSEGYSVELDYDTGSSSYATNNDDYTNWCLATSQWDSADYGTPGTTNDGCP
jgi:hypothetical protein